MAAAIREYKHYATGAVHIKYFVMNIKAHKCKIYSNVERQVRALYYACEDVCVSGCTYGVVCGFKAYAAASATLTGY